MSWILFNMNQPGLSMAGWHTAWELAPHIVFQKDKFIAQTVWSERLSQSTFFPSCSFCSKFRYSNRNGQMSDIWIGWHVSVCPRFTWALLDIDYKVVPSCERGSFVEFCGFSCQIFGPEVTTVTVYRLVLSSYSRHNNSSNRRGLQMIEDVLNGTLQR